MSGSPLEETGTSSTAGTTLRQIYVFTPEPSILPRPNTQRQTRQTQLGHLQPGPTSAQDFRLLSGIRYKEDAVEDMGGILLGLGDSSTLHYIFVSS